MPVRLPMRCNGTPNGGFGNNRFTQRSFAPSGKIVLRSPKLNLTAGLEKLVGLSRGRLEDVTAAVTPLGRVATLICYDGFFERALEKTDSVGAQIIVQPSANAALWKDRKSVV